MVKNVGHKEILNRWESLEMIFPGAVKGCVMGGGCEMQPLDRS